MLYSNQYTHVNNLNDSAKVLQKGEPNVSYICSRYYRAPELIFGATDYTCQIGISIAYIALLLDFIFCSPTSDRI